MPWFTSSVPGQPGPQAVQAPDPAGGTPAGGAALGAPPPASLEVDPSGRSGRHYFEHFFGGALAPIPLPVEWSGHEHTVSLRILEADEQRQAAHYAYVRSEGHPESDEYLLARSICQIAFALDAVDGKPIGDECKTLEERLQLAAALPDTLHDSILEAYADARTLPIGFLSEMHADPNSDGSPTDTGSSAAGLPPQT